MKTIEYKGTVYRQGTSKEANWIVSFVALAEDILDWAGIPRRTTDEEMQGFQRAFDQDRVDQAKDFFQIDVNQSPTALVVGFHPNVPGHPPRVRLEFDDQDEGKNIRSCKLIINYLDDGDEAGVIAAIRSQIDRRITLSGEQEAVDPEVIDEADNDDDEDSGGGEEGELELGRSLLMKLSKRLDDTTWRAANHEALIDLAKPATVIDGQHRLKGAELCERKIPFAVCALFDCQWSEQVFQFTVINYTQKGIEDQFITNNAALSLTQGELNHLQDRLVQAGVNVVEYELMKIVHFHDESPFKNLVNLTEKKNPSLIGYKTMVRLARVWFDGRHQVFRMMLPNLYPDLPKKGDHKARVLRWRKRGDWGVFFLDFWRAVHESYRDKPSHEKNHTLWEVGHSNLIVAIVLFELQGAFLQSLAQQDEDYFVCKAVDTDGIRREMREKVQKRAKKFLEWFPSEFFGARWGYNSLSIGPGRKALQECFEKMVLQKGQFRYFTSGLLTGQTT